MSMSDEAKFVKKKNAPRYKKTKKTFAQKYIPQKGDSTDEIINKLVVITAAIVFIVCLVILGKYFYEIYEAKQNSSKLTDLYVGAQQWQEAIVITAPADGNDPSLPDDVTVITPETPDSPAAPAAPLPPKEKLPGAMELLSINADTVGYVNIPGCVDEPVVRGADNDYYLNHNFYDQKRQCGTCFADYRNVLEAYERSDNVVLYAHNQKDGTMFGNLDYYRWDPGYWKQNKFIYFNTNYSEDVYVIISSFVINIYPEHDDGRAVFDYQNYINFGDQYYTYDEFIKEIRKRSTFIINVECDENDDYLTLSTCSTEWDDSRHVIVARKLRAGETADSFGDELYSRNPNPKWPAIYYKYNGGTYIDEDQ